MDEELIEFTHSDSEISVESVEARNKVNRKCVALIVSAVLATVVTVGCFVGPVGSSLVGGRDPDHTERNNSWINKLPENCGQRTNQSAVPWVGIIFLKVPNHEYLWMNSRVMGTLISSRYVLTNAKSLLQLSEFRNLTNGVRVVFRDIEIETTFASDNYLLDVTTMWNVVRNKSHHQQNVALLRLDRDVEFDVGHQPVCLPSHGTSHDEAVRVEYMAVVLRWEGKYHLEAAVRKANSEECANAIKQEPKGSYICVAFDGESSSITYGSPLTATENINGVERVVQFGFVYLPDIVGGYEIHVNVSQNMRWILEHIEH